ncbi:MAG: AAA family ATPase, partial [Vicinamibacterales bacterium]
MPRIVAISRQFGSGGARVGRGVAQRLGFRYADRQILSEAARLLQMDANDLAPLEERTAGFWGRVGSLFALGSPDTPFMPPALPAVTESDLFAAEQRVIREIAARENAVIVGRGAAHVLDASTPVVRVFLHAPLASRIELAMAEYELPSREAAATVVRESDRARSQFVRRLTGQDWCDANLYDITLNVGLTGIDR